MKLTDWIPGLKLFTSYNKEWFSKDLAAGLSVAAIALPVGIAYSEIAGLPPEAGLYSCIFPMIAYAFFGTSRQLIMGPDAATCLLIASSLSSLAARGSIHYQELSVILAIIVGILCVISGILKLGFVANFLSKPILTGYLNGLAISIIIGQLGKLFGYQIVSGGVFKMLYDFFSKIEQTRIVTLAIGVSTFLFLIIFKKKFPRIPAPLLAVILCIIVVLVLGLEKTGIAVVGHVPSGLPQFGIPQFSYEEFEALFVHSIGIVTISYCSGMLTDKSFAVRNGYQIDANKEFIAFGMSSMFSGFSQGYVVSGADSRTAVNNTAGGKTQLVSVVGALAMLLVILFFTKFLQHLPITTLSAIIISASIGLFNIDYLKKLYLVSKTEFRLAVLTSFCVITIGVLPAVFIAIGLSLVNLLARASKPNDAILGKADGMMAYHNVKDFPNSVTIPGLLIYRFEAALLYFNSEYFQKRIMEIVDSQNTEVKFVLLDAGTVLLMDITAADTISSLVESLAKRNIGFGISNSILIVRNMIKKSGLDKEIGEDRVFETVEEGVNYFNSKVK